MRERIRSMPGMTACICGHTGITWFPATPSHRKWYCPKCGLVCRLKYNLELELKAIRERDTLLRTKVELPASFKPWKVYGNGVRMTAHADEVKANTARDRQIMQQPGGSFWVQYEITAEDTGLADDQDPPIYR